jgi:diacylglycerol kinase family enzyme
VTSALGPAAVADRRFQFLLAGQAGNGMAARRLRALLDRSPALAARSQTAHVQSLGAASHALANLDPETVPVAAGGDGTLSLMVQALHTIGDLGRPIAFLPFGTGNAFAYPHGLLPSDRAIQALHARRTVALDLMITDHPGAPVAVMTLTTGIEAVFIRHFAAFRRWTRPAAIAYAFGRSLGARSTRVTLEVDGELLIPAGTACIGAGLYNTPCYAFGHEVLPWADPGDGQAEAVAYLTRRAYIRSLLGGVRQDPPDAATAVRSWRAARIETEDILQVDGEVIEPAALRVTLAPGALRLLVPPTPILGGARRARLGDHCGNHRPDDPPMHCREGLGP